MANIIGASQPKKFKATDGSLNQYSPSQVTDKNIAGADPDIANLYNAGVFNSEPTLSDINSGFQSPNFSTTPKLDTPSYTGELSAKELQDARSGILSQFQDQINSTKSAYGQLLAQTKLQSQGRLGEDTAIQARRGLAGSDFGGAQTEKVRSLNMSEEQKVLAAQAAALAGIDSTVAQLTQDEINNRRNAKIRGGVATREYFANLETTKKANLEALATAFLTQGYNPLEMDKTKLEQYAKSLGTTTSDIINSYLGGKAAQEASQAENLKDTYTTVGSGSALVDRKTGKVIYQSEKSNDLTPYQQFTATQSIAKDTQARTQNAREMARQANLIKQSYTNIVNGGDRSLNTQAIVTSFNKILDPTSVVRESEYDRTAAGQSLIAQLEGKVQQIATGGAGITDATIKEAADIADQYLKESQASVLQQNERARTMANEFGLNPDFVTTGGYTQTSPDDVSWEDL